MSPASSSFPSDSRKRKHGEDDRDLNPNPTPHEARRVSDFPLVVRREVVRPDSSILAIAAAERWFDPRTKPRPPVEFENVSHGQFQVLSAVLPDHPALNCQTDGGLEKTPTYVCVPPLLLEAKGVVKRVGGDKVLVLPHHSDWFDPSAVHRLERQVVPHFFSGKSAEHTPERYIMLRNRIVAKYMENPGRKLSFGECQGLVPNNELYDLSRIVRFLDHWGIINYLAALRPRGPRVGSSLITEEANGELQITTTPLKSIDSLMQFDRPRSSYKAEDLPSLSCSGSEATGGDVPDLESKIRERFSEHICSYCSRPLLEIMYQSQKEADSALCSDCFHDGKFVVGHSSLEFMRMDLTKYLNDFDGDSWSDQETFLLLEALEIYNDNWNEIAEHVGTKSKAQCILHFIQLPMEDGLLEDIDVPHVDISSNGNKGHNVISNVNSNGDLTDTSMKDDQIPFASSSNPVMSLVAFLAAAIGPRVAASCASAVLSFLTKEDTSTDGLVSDVEGAHPGVKQKDEAMSNRGSRRCDSSVSPDRVKAAAVLGLSAAAIKAKLFADQEEREIQRLSATIINHQLKRLELKLKQFAEVETLLLKECEQVERTRQRLSAERGRLVSTRFSQAGNPTMPASGSIPTSGNTNIRQQSMSLGGHTNMLPAYANSIPTNNMPNHPHMPFMPRQPGYPFVGPRLPLSAIHPSSSPQPSNVMLSSGMPNAQVPSNHHPLLRSMSSNNSNLG